MILDKEAHRPILLSALKNIRIEWSLEKNEDVLKAQEQITELSEAIKNAKLDQPLQQTG